MHRREIIRSFCADALFSTVNLNVALDIMLCVLAQAARTASCAHPTRHTRAERLVIPAHRETAPLNLKKALLPRAVGLTGVM